jgi:hypothetical protein
MSIPNIPRPPAHLEPYVTALGAELAVRFFLAFGGADLYITVAPKGDEKAVAVIGMDGLRALGAIRDRLQKRVPTAKPWIARYLKEVDSLSKADICRTLHASEPSVKRWLEDGGKRPFIDPQLSLF